MSLSKILRNIAAGGALLLSSLTCSTGEKHNSDCFPGTMIPSTIENHEKRWKKNEPFIETKKEKEPKRKRKYKMHSMVSDSFLTDYIGKSEPYIIDEIAGVRGRFGEQRFGKVDGANVNCNVELHNKLRFTVPIETFTLDTNVRIGYAWRNTERLKENAEGYTGTSIDLDIAFLRNFENTFLRGGVRYHGELYDAFQPETTPVFADDKNHAAERVAEYGLFLGFGFEDIDQASFELGYTNGDIRFAASGPTGRQMYANRHLISFKGNIYTPLGGFDGKQIKFLDSFFLLNINANYAVDKYNLFDMVQNTFEFNSRAKFALAFDLRDDNLPNLILGFYFDVAYKNSQGDRMSFNNLCYGPGVELFWSADFEDDKESNVLTLNVLFPSIQYVNDNGKHDFAFGVGFQVLPPRKK